MKKSIEIMADNAYPQDVIDLNETEHLRRGYRRGASDMLVRAIDWLRNNKDNLDFVEAEGGLYGFRFIEAFVNAMD